MKKFICVMLTVILTLSLFSGCGAKTDDGIINVAIIQQLDHASLDEIRNAIEAQLDVIAAEKGLTIQYKDFNGQNDTSVLNQIGAQVVSDQYDLIIPIATLAAQAAVTAAEGTKIPIVYAAVSDPNEAGLVGLPNVTGVSDALNTPFILDMMFAVDPDIQTVGLLYSNSEPNSVTPIKEAKADLDAATAQVTALEGQLTEVNAQVATLETQLAEMDGQIAALQAEINRLTEQNIALETGFVEALTQQPAEAGILQLRVQQNAVALWMENPAVEGQQLQVRLTAQGVPLSEAAVYRSGEAPGALQLTGAAEGISDAVLEYEVQDAAGNAVYRVRIPVQLTAE